MDDGTQINWTGKSGETYRYDIYPIDWEPAPGQDGNFVFVKNAGRLAEAIYIGEGDLQSSKAALLAAGCVSAKGADEFHCRLSNDDAARRDEAKDLLEGNPEAYAPTGCHEKQDG